MNRGDWRHLAAAALVTAAGALLYGYSFGASSNHALYVPAVIERLSPGLYAGDPAVAAAARAPTLYWDLLYAAARAFGLELAAFLLWLAAALGLGTVTWAAARAAGGTRRAAWLAVIFAAVSGALHVAAPWAGDPVAKSFADPTGAAWVPALVAVACWLQERPLAAGVWLLVAALVSPLSGWLTAGALAVASWPERRLAARSAAAGAAALAAAALVFAALGRLGRGDLALEMSLTPNTYASANWPWERWLTAAAWAAAWAAAAGRLGTRSRLARLVWAAVGLGLAGAVLTVRGPGLVGPLLPLRLDGLAAWSGLTAAALVIDAELAAPRRWVAALAGALAFLSPLPGPLALLWAALMWSPAGGAAAAAAGAAAGAWALARPPGDWSATPLSSGAAMLTLGAWGAVALGARREPAPRERAAAAALLAVWLLLPLAALARRPELGMALSPAEAQARALPRGIRLAVAPDASGFRLRSLHPVCAEWTDFNLALFDASAARAWRQRMAALGVDWSRLPAERAAALRRWDAAFLRREGEAPAGGVPGWADARQALGAARACGAAYAVVGDELLPTGPGRS